MASEWIQQGDEGEEEWPLPTWIEGDSLAPYRPCSDAAARHIQKLANVTKEDVLVDLGCGDGRILLETSSSVGCSSIGVEIDEAVADKAKEAVKERHLTDLVEVWTDDLEEQKTWDRLNEKGVTIFTAYLLPEAFEKNVIAQNLTSFLSKPNNRLVSIGWDLPQSLYGKPQQSVTISAGGEESSAHGDGMQLHLYTPRVSL